MVDRSGRGFLAVFDRVQLGTKHFRTEESAHDYQKIVIQKGEKMWVMRKGDRPLRLMEFDWAWPSYRQAIDALMRNDRLPPVTSLHVGGRELQCAGDSRDVQVCIDGGSG
jgi:hypothetical protein